MPLPDASQFNSPTVTENQYKEAQAQLIDHIQTLAAKSEVVSAVTPKADKIYVDNALSTFQAGATKFYATLADANSDIANIMPKLATDTVKDLVNIGEVTNGGTWYKSSYTAASLTKSPYDPVAQAKLDATTKANTAETNAKDFAKNAYDPIFDNKRGNWSAYTLTSFLNIGKRLDSSSGALISDVNTFFYTDYVPVKKGMIFTMRTGAASSARAFMALYDSNKVFLKSVAPTQSYSPHIDMTLSITVEQDGFLVACANTQYIATYALNLLAPYTLYATPADLIDLTKVKKSNDEVTFIISKTHNKINDSNFTFGFNKPNSGVAGNGYSDVINPNKTISVHADFVAGVQYPYRFDYGLSFNKSTQIGKTLVVFFKGRVKSVNTKLTFNWNNRTQQILTAASADWVEFEVYFVEKVDAWGQSVNGTPSLTTSAVDSSISGSIDIELTHFAIIEARPNFIKADYLRVLDNDALSIPAPLIDKKFLKGTWCGKKLCTLGHSIVVQNYFQPILAELLGMNYEIADTVGTTTKQPLGIGGSHIQAVCYSTTDYNYDIHSTQDSNLRGCTFYTRANWVAQYAPDLIIIFNPNNDSLDPAMVGELTDPEYTGSTEILYSAGGYPSLISTMKGMFKRLGEQNPKAKIVFCSDLLNGFTYNNPTTAYNKLNGVGTSNANFIARNDKLKKLCEMYGVQWIDLLHNCWDIYTASSAFTSSDTTHPVLSGHEKIARYIASQL